MKKILIIGAGPIGNYAAYMLSKKGYEVFLYEKKPSVGTPIQCTGIVTSEIDKLIDIPDYVVDNTISSISTNSNSQTITFELKKKEYILCRERFDNFLHDKAKENGAQFFYSHELMGVSEDKIIVRDISKNQIQEIKYDMLIGADGPLSLVRKYLNPKREVKNWIGIQAVAKHLADDKRYDTYFGHDFPNFFGWAVPEGKGYSRIGIAADKDARKIFDNFLFKLGVDKSSIKDMQGGLIPKYSPDLMVKKGNVAVIGDAATHLKATTGGGIIPGMKGALEIIKHLESSNKPLKNRNLKLHKELFAHLMLRETFNQFTDKRYDSLFEVCNNDRIKRVIAELNRDQVLKLGVRIAFAQPRLIMYSPFILRSFLRTKVWYN